MLCPTCFRLNAQVQRFQIKYFETLHRNGYQVAADPVTAAARELDRQRRQLVMHQQQCASKQRSTAA